MEFARSVAALADLPLAAALLEYTNFYIRLGFGRDFSPEHPGWRGFVASVSDWAGPAAAAHRLYLAQPPGTGAPPIVATFGCFAYERRASGHIRLHFADAERDGRSPLAADRQGTRRAELAALFAHVKATTPQAAGVIGASWLYNLDAYRCLFPPLYLATARAIPRAFQHIPLWGQFVNRRGEMRAEMAAELRRRMARQSSLDGLERCFPLPALRLEAPLRDFFEFYEV